MIRNMSVELEQSFSSDSYERKDVTGESIDDFSDRFCFDADVIRQEKREKDGVAKETVLISTEKPIRGGLLKTSGANFDRYLKNPVVLFNHGISMSMCGQGMEYPVGRTTDIEVVEGQGIFCTFEWAKRGIDEEIDKIHNLWDANFIRGASIRFNPLTKPKEKKVDGSKQKLRIFDNWEMIEWSVVTIPADPDTVKDARAALMYLINPQAMRRIFQSFKRATGVDIRDYADLRNVDGLVGDDNPELTVLNSSDEQERIDRLDAELLLIQESLLELSRSYRNE